MYGSNLSLSNGQLTFVARGHQALHPKAPLRLVESLVYIPDSKISLFSTFFPPKLDVKNCHKI